MRFGDIELRVDTTRVTGSVALDPAPRPQIAATSCWIAWTWMPTGRVSRPSTSSRDSPDPWAPPTPRSRQGSSG